MTGHSSENSNFIKLTEELNQGQSLAFDTLYRLLYPSLVNYAVKLTGTQFSAKSVVQDVFTNVWQKLGDIRIEGDVVAYFYRAVYYRAVNELKAGHRSVKMLSEELQQFYFSTIAIQPDGEARMINEELAGILDRAIDSLPERCALIFRMSWIEGLKNKQIAEILGISEKTVEGQITIAVRKLRNLLAFLRITAFFFLPF